MGLPRRSTRPGALLGALLCVSTAARGAAFSGPDLLEITETSVYRWNPATPGDTFIRNTGTSLFGDITRLNDGRYVAYRTIYGGNTPALFQIDPQTGQSTLLVQSATASERVIALAPMTGGSLLGFDYERMFVIINPSTLEYRVREITLSTHPLSMFSGGMATAPNGDIYAWMTGIGQNHTAYEELFKINVNAGTGQVIGGYSGLLDMHGFNGLSFTPDGRLFGFTESGSGSSDSPFVANAIYQINLQTGLPTFVMQRDELADLRGVIFVVPEPSGLLLGAIGAGDCSSASDVGEAARVLHNRPSRNATRCASSAPSHVTGRMRWMDAPSVTVAAIVPAAGASGRMGTSKQLLDVGGRPMVLGVIEALLSGGVSHVILVVNQELEARFSERMLAHVRCARNDDRGSGMIDSVRIGLTAEERDNLRPAGYLVCPCDAAGLAAADVQRCVAAFVEFPDQIIVATFAGRRGHPVIFPTSLAKAVRSAECDGGLNHLVRNRPQKVREVACESPGTVANVNTPTDYERLRELKH